MFSALNIDKEEKKLVVIFGWMNLPIFTKEAAFERVSTIKIQPHDQLLLLDFRTAKLPKGRWVEITEEGSDKPAYNPMEHREPKNPITVWMAYFNLIRTGFGAGLLGFPLAISQTGMGLGAVLGTFAGLLIIHMHIVLLKCLNDISKRLGIPVISYRYGFRLALLHGPPITHSIGRHGPCIISSFMLLSQAGICTVFIDFTADCLRDLLDIKSSRTCMLYLFVPYLLLEFSMKSLKIVSYAALLGNVLNVVGLVFIFYHIFLCPHGEFVHANIEAMPLAFSFGTYLFNLSAVGVVLTLDKNLSHPQVMSRRCTGVVAVGMGLPLVISLVFGMLGYWSFGTMEENVLRSLPYDDPTSMVAVMLYMVAVALAYPIQCYPAIQIIQETVRNHDHDEEPSESTMKLVEIISRPSFVLLTFVIAYLIPMQAPFVAFVGNLCTTMLALVFPALMDVCLMYPGPYGRCNMYLIKNLLIILLGVTSWLFGVVICGHLIYLRIASSASPNEAEFF